MLERLAWLVALVALVDEESADRAGPGSRRALIFRDLEQTARPGFAHRGEGHPTRFFLCHCWAFVTVRVLLQML